MHKPIKEAAYVHMRTLRPEGHVWMEDGSMELQTSFIKCKLLKQCQC